MKVLVFIFASLFLIVMIFTCVDGALNKYERFTWLDELRNFETTTMIDADINISVEYDYSKRRNENVGHRSKIIKNEYKIMEIHADGITYANTIYVDNISATLYEDIESRILYYNGLYYSGKAPVLSVTAAKILSSYMKEMTYTENKTDNCSIMSSTVNLKEYFKDNTTESTFQDIGELENASCMVYYKDNKIYKLVISIPGIEAGYTYSYIVDVQKYGEVDKSVYYNKDVPECSYETLEQKFQKDVQMMIQNKTSVEKTCELMVPEKLSINVGSDSLEISGEIIKHINSNTSTLLEFDNVDIIDGNIDLNQVGSYNITVYKYYNGIEFSKEVTVYVINEEKKANVEEVFESSFEGIDYSFNFENFFCICSNGTLYIIDLDKIQVVKKIDIFYKGNSHYVKGDYLYITSYKLYNKVSEDDEAYEGYITKINYKTFEIEKQVLVSAYPYSVIVDKRDNVIISKGENKTIYAAIVDMETGTLKHILAQKIYSQDALLYDEEQDSICVVSKNSDFKFFKYSKNNDNYISFYHSFNKDIEKVSFRNENVAVVDNNYINFSQNKVDCILLDHHLSSNYETIQASYVNENSCIIVSKINSKFYVINYEIGDDNNMTYQLYEIQNRYLSQIENVFEYNGYIYLFDSTSAIQSLLQFKK